MKLVTVVSLIARLLSLSLVMGSAGCGEQTVVLKPEHVSVNQLKQELANSSLYQHMAPDVQLTFDDPDGVGELRLSGQRGKVNQIIDLAKSLDIPQSYNLEISNTSPKSISTATKHMRLLIHPDQTITLGHISLQQGPWGDYVNNNAQSIELTLSKKLLLNIRLASSSSDNTQYYSTSQPLKLNQWLQVLKFDSSLKDSERYNGESRQTRLTTLSTKKQQLWLRLVRSSQ